MRSGHHERCSNPSLALKELTASSAGTVSPCPEAPGRQERSHWQRTEETVCFCLRGYVYTRVHLLWIGLSAGFTPKLLNGSPGSFDAGGESALIPVCVDQDEEMDPEMMSYFL